MKTKGFAPIGGAAVVRGVGDGLALLFAPRERP